MYLIFKNAQVPPCTQCRGAMEEGVMTNGGIETEVWVCNRHDDILPMLEKLANPLAENRHYKKMAKRKLN